MYIMYINRRWIIEVREWPLLSSTREALGVGQIRKWRVNDTA